MCYKRVIADNLANWETVYELKWDTAQSGGLFKLHKFEANYRMRNCNYVHVYCARYTVLMHFYKNVQVIS